MNTRTLLLKGMGISLLLISLIISGCTSCSDSDAPIAKEEQEGWIPATYVAEVKNRSVKLILHPIADTVGILEADLLIQHTDTEEDRSDSLFEALNCKINATEKTLDFDWQDGFGNKGKGKITATDPNADTIELALDIEEVISDRNMQFIDHYELIKAPANPNPNPDPDKEGE